MVFTGSKFEEDKALELCRERRRFVKQAVDGRYSLAATHALYVQHLRNVGTALQKLAEPESVSESSLYTSTSATPGPLALTEKSISQSQLSYSSPSHSQHVEAGEHLSPVPSPLSSGRFHMNYMKAGRRTSMVVEEKPPINEAAALQQAPETPKSGKLQSDGSLSPEPHPQTPSTPPWDYFDFLHPIDSHLSFQDARSLSHDFDSVDDISRLREEEGIPDLEVEGENASRNGRDESVDSEEDFDQPSPENLVRMFRNHSEVSNIGSKSDPPFLKSVNSDSKQKNEEKQILTNGIHDSDENPSSTPLKLKSFALALPMNGKEKEVSTESKYTERDFLSCMKEIEELFARASESGKEIPRMLEAKINFRPLFPEKKAHRSKASDFFASCFSCYTGGSDIRQAPDQNETKVLTWHRSASSLSSSSRIPLGATSKDDSEDFSSYFGSSYMNSGSHASTLDRLYAWERKLYDEVKASGTIRSEYDMKCRLLREEESKGDKSSSTDKIRAAVKDLHSRILVAIHRIDSISRKIEGIRDEELQPQLEELIGGFTRMWMMMLDCHKKQFIIVSMARKNGSVRISSHSESHRQATGLLEFELSSMHSSFTKWISVHRYYLQSINGWLNKCVFPLKQHRSARRRRNEEFDPRRDRAPPIFITCREWLLLLDNLPTKELELAIKHLINVAANLLPHPERTHIKQKLSLSISRKTSGFSQLGEEVPRADAPVDWSVNMDTLQSTLQNLLDSLKTFAEKSVEKYEALQSSITYAKEAYEKY